MGRWRGPLPPFVSMRPKLPNDVPRFVEESQGQFAGWLGPLHDPLTIDADPSKPDYRVGELTLHPEISVQRLAQRRELLSTLDRRLETYSPQFAALDQNHRRAFELLTSASAQRGAFNLDEEPASVRNVTGSIRTANRFCKPGAWSNAACRSSRFSGPTTALKTSASIGTPTAATSPISKRA
jgi:hypothetical protein